MAKPVPALPLAFFAPFIIREGRCSNQQFNIMNLFVRIVNCYIQFSKIWAKTRTRGLNLRLKINSNNPSSNLKIIRERAKAPNRLKANPFPLRPVLYLPCPLSFRLAPQTETHRNRVFIWSLPSIETSRRCVPRIMRSRLGRVFTIYLLWASTCVHPRVRKVACQPCVLDFDFSTRLPRKRCAVTIVLPRLWNMFVSTILTL